CYTSHLLPFTFTPLKVQKSITASLKKNSNLFHNPYILACFYYSPFRFNKLPNKLYGYLVKLRLFDKLWSKVEPQLFASYRLFLQTRLTSANINRISPPHWIK